MVTEDGSFVVRYVYDEAGKRLSAEFDYADGTARGAQNANGEYGENPASDIAVNGIGKVWYRTSLLNSTLYAVDADGETVVHMIYDAWGNPLIETYADANFSGLENLNNFTGYTWDETLGLYFAQNRFYDPSTHRFTQEDIIKDGNNWYVYCANSPVVYVDWDGRVYIIAWSYSKQNAKDWEVERIRQSQRYIDAYDLTTESWEAKRNKQTYNHIVLDEDDGVTDEWTDDDWKMFEMQSSFARAAKTKKNELIRSGIDEKDIVFVRVDDKEDLAKKWAEWATYGVVEGLEFFSHGHFSVGPEVYLGSDTFWEDLARTEEGILNWDTVNGYAKFYGCNTGVGAFAQRFANHQGVTTYAQPGISSFSHNPDRYVKIDTHGFTADVYLATYKEVLSFICNNDLKVVRTSLIPMKVFKPEK